MGMKLDMAMGSVLRAGQSWGYLGEAWVFHVADDKLCMLVRRVLYARFRRKMGRWIEITLHRSHASSESFIASGLVRDSSRDPLQLRIPFEVLE